MSVVPAGKFPHDWRGAFPLDGAYASVWRMPPDGGFLFFCRWLADVARHPGMVASRRATEWRPAGQWALCVKVLFPLACGCCPALGRGRLPAGDRMAARRAVPVRRRRSLTGIDSRDGAGGERGVPLYTPYDPRTPPCLVWRRASLSHVVYLVRRSPQGANRRASSRFAGDMRACCGAPAARGSPPRPGSLGGGIFSSFRAA